MNAITTSSVLDDLKTEEQTEWFEPNLQLVVGAFKVHKGYFSLDAGVTARTS